MADEDTQETTTPWWKELLNDLPLDDLKSQASDYAKALAEKGSSGLTDKLNDFTESMTPGGEGSASGEAVKQGAEKLTEGKNPVSAGASALVTGAKEKLTPGSSGGSSDVKKFSNIVESIEVGVPVRVAYNQWTQFQDWTSFMKRVENAEQESDEKIEFKGKVFLSHRSWEATITQQVPDEQIVWESTGEKGHLDGAVTFHELGPRLTRILIIVNYYPQGFVEKVGNMGRPVGKRIRVESRLFARYVMTQTILDEDAVEGWRGEIRDREVVRTHEEALEDEQREAEDAEQEDYAPEEADDQDESTEQAPEDGDADPEEEDTDEADDSSDEEEVDEPEDGSEVEGAEDADAEEPDADTDAEDADADEDAEDAEDAGAEEPDDAEPEETVDSDVPEEDGDFEYVDEESDTKEGTS